MNATTNPSKVLIGTSLGEGSDEVVAAGARIAGAIGATIHLAHAFTVPVMIAGGPFVPVAYAIPPGHDELAEASRRAMEEQIARLRIGNGAGVVRHVAEGPAHRVLGEIAGREQVDLIVVGAVDTLGAHVFGSTASRVVRRARCPVLALRGPLAVPPRRVLMPVDLSPISAEVVGRGLALIDRFTGGHAGAWGGTAVEALYVLEPAVHEGFIPHFDLDGAVRGAAEKLALFLAPQCRDGWQIEPWAAYGGAREEILYRIEATHPELLIMGTHGLSGFERFLLGSVAEGVVRACRTSVLVIPPLAALAGAAVGPEAAVAMDRAAQVGRPAGQPAQPAA